MEIQIEHKNNILWVFLYPSMYKGSAIIINIFTSIQYVSF